MKKLVLKMMAVCAGALIVSCGSGKNMLSVSSLDGEWNITEVDGQKISTERMPFIGFDVAQKRIYGNSGCNRMMGSFEADSLKPGTLKFGQIGSTRMMCPDMKTEQMVLGALDKVTSFQTVSDKPGVITLCNQDGQPLMTLEKKAAPEVSLSDLSGEWVIELVNGKKIVGTAEVTPFIGFNLDESRIYGNVGCNTINGALTQEDGKPNSLRFDNVATTMMMCPDMKTEQMVLGALDKVTSFQTVSDKPGVITLCNQDGQPLMTLEKKAAPEVSLSDLSGEWVIELVNGKKIVGTAEVTPFIGFNLDESRIYGNVGCNTINGALTQEDGKPNSLRFDNVATTMMMCPDMETETIVLNALNETKSFSMKDDKVYLLGENGNELLVLKKQ